MKVCSKRLKLTWFGMSRLSLGNRTQFLHILLTRSSLKMMISWLQYWILKKRKTKHFDLFVFVRWCLALLRQQVWLTAKAWHLPAWVSGEDRKWHPLSELLCDVIGQGRSEEDRLIYNCPKQMNTISRSRLTSAEWCPDRGLQDREQTGSDCCTFKENMVKIKQS